MTVLGELIGSVGFAARIGMALGEVIGSPRFAARVGTAFVTTGAEVLGVVFEMLEALCAATGSAEPVAASGTAPIAAVGAGFAAFATLDAALGAFAAARMGTLGTAPVGLAPRPRAAADPVGFAPTLGTAFAGLAAMFAAGISAPGRVDLAPTSWPSRDNTVTLFGGALSPTERSSGAWRRAALDECASGPDPSTPVVRCATELLSGAIPCPVFPSGAIPDVALPRDAMPGTALPSGAMPGSAPSGAMPSTCEGGGLELFDCWPSGAIPKPAKARFVGDRGEVISVEVVSPAESFSV